MTKSDYGHLSATAIADRIKAKLSFYQLSKDGILEWKGSTPPADNIKDPSLTSEEVAFIASAIDKSLSNVEDSFREAIAQDNLEHFSMRYFASYNFSKALTLAILNELKHHQL